ncbi:MAG: hypothetical protein K8R68_01145 [Bacteroidales bacterium]|nr:hypothetical protein [Bacteroidales bacterium]
MIIKKIIIENFLCYHSLNEFELSDGLNIILGYNGEGKTKFFEAVDWLFSGDNRDLDLLVSAKTLAEADIEEEFRVRVTIIVEQYEEKVTISKSYFVKKLEDDEITTFNYSIEGIEENKKGERNPVDGKILLNRIFPPEIRRYSMFKGEAELNIFDNDEALSILINSFSRAKYYEKYAEKGSFLREKAEKVVNDATRANDKNQKEYKRLEAQIKKLEDDRARVNADINVCEDQIKKFEENIQDAEKYVTNAEALETINKRIASLEQQFRDAEKLIDENYTVNLFDENWILINFEKIHTEFSKIINELGSNKRKLQKEFDKQIGIKEGKKQLKEELLNNSFPLPVGVPSKAHMEEMLKEELCKICNRPAKKGSEAYKFMMSRLEEYLKSQEPIDDEDEEELEVLFNNDYTSRLFNLNVSHEDNLGQLREIRKRISELFEFNEARRKDLATLHEKLDKEKKEREDIIGTSNIGAEKLTNVLKNYNSWQTDLSTYKGDNVNYLDQLKEIDIELKRVQGEKDNIDIKIANTFQIKTRAILRDIEIIFKDTREKKFDEFIELLQIKSNEIFDKLNIESFTGTIVFNKKTRGGNKTVNIELQEDSGRILHKPNTALETSMHISILFAISLLASEFREENFPMIFDAPTSSFAESKTAQFLDLINDTSNQKVLLIKSFFNYDSKTEKLSVRPEFKNVKRDKAFWILLERPFDRKKLETLNTQVITL